MSKAQSLCPRLAYAYFVATICRQILAKQFVHVIRKLLLVKNTAETVREAIVKGRKKEKLVAFNKTNILEAACALFEEKGIAGTTMDDIAEASGYSKPTIYTYFKSKEELVSHLVLDGMERFCEKTRDAAQKKGPFIEFYTQFCRSIAAMHAEQPMHYEGLAGRVPFDDKAPPDDILKKISVSGDALNNILEERIQTALDEKEIAFYDGIPIDMMLIWFCILGIVEKSSLKEEYIAHRLGMTREDFLNYAFKKMFTLIKR